MVSPRPAETRGKRVRRAVSGRAAPEREHGGGDTTSRCLSAGRTPVLGRLSEHVRRGAHCVRNCC